MRKTILCLTLAAILLSSLSIFAQAHDNRKQVLFEFKLGNEVLYSRYHHLINGKRVGLITNQSGVNRKGQSTIDILANDPFVNLVALFGPEHGIDGQAKAGHQVETKTHPELNIPIYSLYGATRKPTENMLKDVEVLIYDVQDIGSRTYTYISTLQYAMEAAKEYGKTVIVLDRPNPVGCEIVDAPVLEDYYKTFVGVDNLPMAHGMTVGEVAKFFNRNINVDLRVIPMEGYTRDMIYQDTGLEWIATSPNIPDIDSVFGYMATGLGEGTGIRQLDKFKWIGGAGIDSDRFAQKLNQANLPGVNFIPDDRGSLGGVKLQITDYHQFNPAKTGLYALAYAKQLNNFSVPKSTKKDIVMFDKIMGTNRVGQWLEHKLSPEEMERRYQPELEEFKKLREQYLIYGYTHLYAGNLGHVGVVVNNTPLFLDSAPYIDSNDRTMAPVRAITEAMGATVEWEPEYELVTIEYGDSKIELQIGNSTIVVNGIKHIMDTVPVIKNSRTMIPLRYVGEYLGADITWDKDNRLAIVSQ